MTTERAGHAANANAPSDGSVQQLLRTLGVPLAWDPPVAAEGVLFVVTPEPHTNLSLPLPRSGCSFYSEADGRRRAYHSLPALAEATLSAHLLRRQMAPALPIALATPRPTAGFVRSRSELAGVWDLLVELDEAALQRATGLPLSARSYPFLYKLVALLRAPFERTLFMDADVMVPSRVQEVGHRRRLRLLPKAPVWPFAASKALPVAALQRLWRGPSCHPVTWHAFCRVPALRC